jgi:hypothetical protein
MEISAMPRVLPVSANLRVRAKSLLMPQLKSKADKIAKIVNFFMFNDF